MKDLLGSNQYKKKRPFLNSKAKIQIAIGGVILYAMLLTILVVTNFINTHDFRSPFIVRFELKPQSPWTDKVISPLASQSAKVFIQVSAAEKEVIETDPVRKEIREVFGEHADKAFLVLSCENNALNPEAVNTAGNYPVGSKDIGIFQINNHWQNIGNENFLKDPSINIRIAWNIFKRDGYSFKLWTCGRKYGV